MTREKGLLYIYTYISEYTYIRVQFVGYLSCISLCCRVAAGILQQVWHLS